MKTAELQALGLNQEQIDAIFKINGLDVENAKTAKDKEIADLTAQRDGIQSQLDTATATLKKFEGIDPEQIQTELQSYKTKAEDAEKRFHRELTQRDQRDWLTAKLNEYGVKSPLARKQIATEVMSEKDGLKWKDAEDGKTGMFYGFDDYMKAAKAEDASLYQTAEEKAAAEKAAKQKQDAPFFTGPTGDSGSSTGEKYTPPKIF